MLKVKFFRNFILLIFLASFLFPSTTSCAKHDANTVKVVKPKGKKKTIQPPKTQR
jgi:hypothetical protein